MPPTRHTAVADLLAEQIRDGVLAAGTRLPTHRALATQHGIALATATKVYRTLTEAGLISGEPGRGTFVRDLSGYSGLEPQRHTAALRVADLSFNQPLARAQGDHLRHALREIASEGELFTLLLQEPPGGRTRDRAAVATYLLGLGVDVAPASVLLTTGGQQGLDAALSMLPAGSCIAVDALTYPGFRLLASLRRFELAPIPADTGGMDLDYLARLCRKRRVAALFTIPTLHNPLGYVMSTTARERIATLADRHDMLIIEDATYAFLDENSPPAIQTLAPDRTCLVGSMSKNLAPGLRFGFVVTPERFRPALLRSLRTLSWGTSSIATRLVTRWITDGTIDDVENMRRRDAQQRQRLARTELAGLDYHGNPASFFGWLVLPDEARMDIVAHNLAERGVLVSTADAFSTASSTPNALRLALGTPSLGDLVRALQHVRDVVSPHIPGVGTP